MSMPDYREAALEFTGPDSVTHEGTDSLPAAHPVLGGLINSSFKISGSSFAPILLQQINKNVFHDPEAVQENYMSIWNFLQTRKGSLFLPSPVITASGKTIYCDKKGKYWRAFRFIEEGTTRDVARSAAEAFTTAQTFGRFTAAFENYDACALHQVIPDFHNLSFRYGQFETALQTAAADRKNEVAGMIEELKSRKVYKNFFDTIKSDVTRYRIRVMHHDAKIANVLFHKETGEVICAVDFDTVMPGHYFSDLGDMVRSMACSLDEASIDFSNIHIREDIYNAIVSGYLSVMEPLLTPEEKAHIHHAGIILIYMQALRFLTDYLENDRYYRIQYPEQNKDRAYNQLVLLKSLEQFLQEKLHYNLND